MKHRNPLALAILAACLLSATAQAAEPALFTEHLVPAANMRQADRFLGDIADAPSTRQLQVVQAQAAQVDIATERLYINLVPGKPLLVDQTNAYRNDDGTVVWNGLVGGTAAAAERMQRHGPDESFEDPLNTATIVRNGDMLTGSVRVQGRLYRIEPIGQGRHAVTEVDEAALPPDDGGRPIPMGDATDFTPAASPTAAAAPTIVRVLMVYSRHAGDNTADPTGWAQAVIAEANRAYSGSRVNMRLQLAGTRVTDYREYSAPGSGTGGWASFEADLLRFRRKNDGHLDGVHALRNERNADIMMLVRRGSQEACGLATEILANADTAFAALSRQCGPGNYTFHHEVGHLQGARHNPTQDPSTRPFAHGHGFVSRRGGFSTVMAYPPRDGSAPRVMWISNPDLFLNNVRMGTPATHDNARVMNQTRNRMAGFR